MTVVTMEQDSLAGGVLAQAATPLPVVAVSSAGGVLDAVDLGWCEHRFSGSTARRMAGVIALCDGERTVAGVAEALAAPPARVARAVTELYALGVVTDTADQPVPAAAFQRHIVSVGRTLRTRMSEQADLLGGSLHRRRLLGSLVETWHFVSSAPFHISPAVAQAADPGVRDALSHLFADEWQHGRWLREGLLAAGISAAELARSRPLPGTQNVINFLRVLAGHDPLSYAVCAAVNESPKTDTAIKRGWDELIARDLLPAEALMPFRGHELEDEAADHGSIAEQVFAERAALSSAEQRRVRDTLVSFIAVQAGCYREMKEFYGAVDGPLTWSA
ncbi:pyrroloquinoline quinone (PQQ) biosynthesis protein C [Actinokineospora baliensis]|uniref:iron-containing redox enzyme family protein n=1 Tax=Actinokineospora baliensis TaxID=547056 RepID=UPI00195F06B5|nr:iron-containing redox enzyme family protein [Actinokineospora baliensis]MBM7774419.1 pyrroloquinoline quinone (PQQ) biosynthesis protein C [Actinokineospora baliensis]